VVGPVSRADLWLLHPPSDKIEAPVWQVVCLAAISACEFGRATLYRQLAGHPTGPSALRATVVDSVSALAGHRFWFLISDFAQDRSDISKLPKAWSHVGPDHPFLAVVDGALNAVLPAALALDI
jgi:hypothetical protein